MGEPSWFTVVAVAILGSSVLTAIVTWFRDRRKDAAHTEATTVSAMRETVESLRAEVKEARAEVAEYRREALELRAENRRLIEEMRELELSVFRCANCEEE